MDVRQTGLAGETEETTERREQNKARAETSLATLSRPASLHCHLQEVAKDAPDLEAPVFTQLNVGEGGPGEDPAPSSKIEVS